jgi:hypothetical protein
MLPQNRVKLRQRGNFLQSLGLGILGARTLFGEIAGRVERNRQNQYDYTQQTSLGMMNPMPARDYQPNAYSLYARYGGRIRKFARHGKKFSNDTKMDMTQGYNLAPSEMKKGGKWIQKAVNPAHKGYCTPMTKSTCTPRRKALARTFKKHHGFH